MTTYELIVEQQIRYTTTLEAESPEAALAAIHSGTWDDTNNEVLSDRVRVFDESEENLLLDTDHPRCPKCGRGWQSHQRGGSQEDCTGNPNIGSRPTHAKSSEDRPVPLDGRPAPDWPSP